MEPPLELRTLDDARASSRALYDLFLRQVGRAIRHGHNNWKLVRWSEDVCFNWGMRSEGARLIARLERAAQVPVRIHTLYNGLNVTINTPGTHPRLAKAPSGRPGQGTLPAPQAKHSAQANTMLSTYSTDEP